MKRLFDFDRPIISSLLETDTYKIRMLYYIWNFFPNLKTQFAFTNRTTSVQLADALDIAQLREEINFASKLSFQDCEIDFLRQNEKYPEEFLQFLTELRLSEINIDCSSYGQLIIETAEDYWPKTTLWELIVLPIVNELYARKTLSDNNNISDEIVIAGGERRLLEKVNLLKGSGVKAMQFGLRRRLSGLWEKHMTEMALDLMPENIVAVSNMKLARELSVSYGGTNAHELSMAVNALRWNDGPEAAWRSQYEVFEKWFDLFEESARIILPDTFGSKQFLENIPSDLAQKAKGFREDSGDSFEFGRNVFDMWRRFNIDFTERDLFFSNGLEAKKMISLHNYFSGQINVLFGWGTNFSNDTGFVQPISIVMKLIKAAGNPAVKLSDNLAKAIGELEAVTRNKKLFGYNVDLNESCVY